MQDVCLGLPEVYGKGMTSSLSKSTNAGLSASVKCRLNLCTTTFKLHLRVPQMRTYDANIYTFPALKWESTN